MGCTPCEQKRKAREEAARLNTVTINMKPSCGYNISQLTKWKEVFDCAYSKGLLESVNITEEQYGSYIGILNYTIDNLNEDGCKYDHELGIILNATHVLVALGC